MAVTSRGISFQPSPNKTSSSPPYRVVSKIETVPNEKSNEELPAIIGDDSYYSPLVIDDDLNMGDASSGNYSLNNHTLSQQYRDSNNGDVSSGYDF